MRAREREMHTEGKQTTIKWMSGCLCLMIKEVEKDTEENKIFALMAPSSSVWYFSSPPNEVSFQINLTFPAIQKQENTTQNVNTGFAITLTQ